MVDISHALTVQGWMSETELTWLAEAASKSLRIVEIGVYKGRSTCALAANTRGHVWSVDIWSECGSDGWYFDVFRKNVARYSNITPVNRASIWAAREFQSEIESGLLKPFDLIFIDAAHDEFNVRQDIAAWRPLLAEGGIFAGHDYNFKDHPDVKKVVDELLPNRRVVDTIWVAE